jgi:hypothetical protein
LFEVDAFNFIGILASMCMKMTAGDSLLVDCHHEVMMIRRSLGLNNYVQSESSLAAFDPTDFDGERRYCGLGYSFDYKLGILW